MDLHVDFGVSTNKSKRTSVLSWEAVFKGSSFVNTPRVFGIRYSTEFNFWLGIELHHLTLPVTSRPRDAFLSELSVALARLEPRNF